MKKKPILRSIIKKKSFVKPKPQKVTCHVCGQTPTHVIMLELREKPGPPLKENAVLHLVCEEHISTDFDHWVPRWAFTGMCNQAKNEGFILNKQFCTINVVTLNKQNDKTKSSN